MLSFPSTGSLPAPALRMRLSRVPGASRTRQSRKVRVKSDGSRIARSISQSGWPLFLFMRGISTDRSPVLTALAIAAAIRSLSEPSATSFGVTPEQYLVTANKIAAKKRPALFIRLSLYYG